VACVPGVSDEATLIEQVQRRPVPQAPEAARDAFFLSAQTIHRRPRHRAVGYRFTVVVPLAKKRQARALLDRFLSGLSFPEDSRATDD
jgi:hypothetical protein